MKRAVVIVDMLNDFVFTSTRYAPKLPVEKSTTIIQEIKEIKEYAEENGVPVLYLNDAHDPDDKEFEKWPEHAVKGTYGAQVIDDLVPEENDVVFEKQDLSGFTNPEFEKYLKKEGIEELIVAGVATDYCVRAVALDTKSKYGEMIPGAISRGYKVTLVVDAIKGVDEIKVGDGASIPKTRGAVAKALLEMGKAGVSSVFADDLEELLKTGGRI